jgi:flagellar motor switch protein FliG
VTGTTARRRDIRIDDLTGLQKAAVFLVTLGPEDSLHITQQLTAEELERISLEIARMDRVPVPVAEAVLDEWAKTEQAAFSLAQGGVETARQILEATLGPTKAAAVLKRIEMQLRDTAGFRTLRQADPQQLASVLRNEYPQAIALILAHLDASLVSEVLKQLDPALGGDVLYRMARMEKVLPEVLQVVDRSLGSDATLSLSEELSAAGGPSAVAAVLNLVSGSLEKELLDGIDRQDHELCEEVKSLMFVFEDIAKLDDRSLQRVLREVESKELALALKAASEELKQRIRSMMSARAVGALDEEMEFLGPVRLRDVETAQATIVRRVRTLEEAGEITIGGGTDDFIT